jgi:serine/threonine-protein kinase HipA
MDILVYADWKELVKPAYMGVLSATRTRGSTIFAFSYDRQWIKTGKAQNLDPDLQFYNGSQYAPGGRSNFGLFLDSSPDRWGRVLMDRREAILARIENRKPVKLFEEDYLLGVYDNHRMGALRFRTEPEGPFLNNNKGLSAPPWTNLRELEFASTELEKGKLKEKDALRWINLLIAPGASLGGEPAGRKSRYHRCKGHGQDICWSTAYIFIGAIRSNAKRRAVAFCIGHDTFRPNGRSDGGLLSPYR